MNQLTSPSQEQGNPVQVPTSPTHQAGGGPVQRSNQKRIVKKASKSPSIPTLIRQVNQPTEDEPPILNMNPADQEPQSQDEFQPLKKSHAQESCKLSSLEAEVLVIKSSLAEMLDLMKKRTPCHQAESPITSEKDHEVLYLRETIASTNNARDGNSTSSSSSSTSSSSTSYDIPCRARTAAITLKNVIPMARDTFFNGPSKQLTNAMTSSPMVPQTFSSSNYTFSSSRDIPSRLHFGPPVTQPAHIATPTIITVQGLGHNGIQYLEDLSLPAVRAFKFNIDEAKQRHPASMIHYASYIRKGITLKLQTFASCCEGFKRLTYSSSPFSTCLSLSELSDEDVLEIILMNILPETANGVRVKLMQHTGYFPTIRDSISSSNLNEWYDHFITFTHSICQGWEIMDKAVSLKDRIKSKKNAAMPILDNAANGILKLLMDRVHPESTRNNILTTHNIGPNYNHPEQYFVPIIAYLANLLTNIETTEENIDGLNNAFRNVPYLFAPRFSNITEKKPITTMTIITIAPTNRK